MWTLIVWIVLALVIICLIPALIWTVVWLGSAIAGMFHKPIAPGSPKPH
jgi:hypothetical protein